MHRVEIHCASRKWLDHAGNEISKLVFAKDCGDGYTPGWYPLQSCGEIYQNLDSIPEGPAQSLTEWTIAIPAIYSSPDGSFSTPDLFYSLEAMNESFNLIGCVVFLLDDNWRKFVGAVDKFETSDGITRIRISDLLTDTAILPPEAIPEGSSQPGYVEVRMTKDREIYDEILLPGGVMDDRQLYIYEKKKDEYLPVQFITESLESLARYEPYGNKLVFNDKPLLTLPYELEKDDERLDLHPSDARILLPAGSTEPADLIIGNYGNEERIQVWNALPHGRDPAPGDYDPYRGYEVNWGTTALARNPSRENWKKHPRGSPIRRENCERWLKLELDEAPVSLMVRSTSGDPKVKGYPCNFLKLSENFNAAEIASIGYDNFPTIIGKGTAIFSAKLPDRDLPSGAQPFAVFCAIGYGLSYSKPDAYLYCGTPPDSFSRAMHMFITGNGIDSVGPAPKLNQSCLAALAPPLADSQTIKIVVDFDYSSSYFHLYSLRAHRAIKIPYSDSIKLYVKVSPTATAEDVKDYRHLFYNDRVDRLLSRMLGFCNLDAYVSYSLSPINAPTYTPKFLNKKAQFRGKLRSLAGESATLIRTAAINASGEPNNPARFRMQFYIAALVPGTKTADKTIPVSAILLNDNIYDFKTQTAEQMDVCTGISIEYGSRRLDITSETQSTRLGAEWDDILCQLRQNKDFRETDNIKAYTSDWISGEAEAERMAYSYLLWLCKPLRTAEIGCASDFLPSNIQLGTYLYIDLPGYPEKLRNTAWLVTETRENLDTRTTRLKLLEAWFMNTNATDRYLLKEDFEPFLTEEHQAGIKLERG